jgi:hypothetical protein
MDAATVLAAEWNSFCLRYIRASSARWYRNRVWLENGISYFGTNRKRAAEMLMEEQVHQNS